MLLRPFWGRSRAVVATWLAEYCIQFLAVHACMYAFAKPADFKFPREKVLRLALKTAGGVTSLEGQLVNS